MSDVNDRIEWLERLQESCARDVQKLALLISDVAAICKRDIEDVQTLRVVDTIDVLLRVTTDTEQVKQLTAMRDSVAKNVPSDLLDEQYLESQGWYATDGSYTHDDTALHLNRRDGHWLARVEVYDIGELYTKEQHRSMCQALGIGCKNQPTNLQEG